MLEALCTYFPVVRDQQPKMCPGLSPSTTLCLARVSFVFELKKRAAFAWAACTPDTASPPLACHANMIGSCVFESDLSMIVLDHCAGWLVFFCWWVL